jgi:5-methylcytosine-specific restriction protein B
MKSYLLSWNPKHFSNGGEGSSKGQLVYKVGEKIEWSCHSKQVKQGDIVYLIKLGDGARGIIAKGVVTKSSYMGECWKDESKQRSYIEFELQGLRNTCEQGLVPFVLLQNACPEQQWSIQSSGIQIREQYQSAIDDFWQQGSAKHSLSLLLDWIKNNHFNPEGWYKDYQETCQLKDKIISTQSVDDEDLTKVWLKKVNGISSVGNGFMYQKELDKNKGFLQKLTLDIVNNPTKEMFDDVFKRWSANENFKRTLYSVIHRVFALADPEHITSIVGKEYLKAIFSGLNTHFELSLLRTDHWYQDNEALLQSVSLSVNKEYDAFIRNILLWELYVFFSKKEKPEEKGEVTESNSDYDPQQTGNEGDAIMLGKPLNQIFYGPPGTGKTYQLQQLIKNYTSDPEVVDPSIWLDEHLNELTWMQVIALCLLDIGEKSKVKQIINHEYYQRKAKLNNRQGNLAPTAWSFLQQFTTEDSKTVSYKSRSEPSVFDKTPNSEWYIVQDKLELIDDISALYQTLKTGPQSKEVIKRYSSTTFHQSYGYEEFIQGLKAKSTNDNGISYAVEPGIFAKLCDRASKDPNHKYAMFIDEINRGNISKIFGELITLIESDKRKGCSNEMTVQLTYDGEQFSVPANVDIIGTMNTADRSLAMMDTALRRRFDFVEMMPRPELFAGKSVNGIKLDLLLSKMNERIEVLYDREHTLGHAFFMPVADKVDLEGENKAFVELQHVFRNKIIPLLEEYFFEDWNKISLVLGDNRKKSKALTPYVFIKKHVASYNDIFGEDHGLETYEDKKTTFKLADFDDQHSAWHNNLAYQAIYDETVLKKADTALDKDEESATGEDSVVAEKSNA